MDYPVIAVTLKTNCCLDYHNVSPLLYLCPVVTWRICPDSDKSKIFPMAKLVMQVWFKVNILILLFRSKTIITTLCWWQYQMEMMATKAVKYRWMLMMFILTSANVSEVVPNIASVLIKQRISMMIQLMMTTMQTASVRKRMDMSWFAVILRILGNVTAIATNAKWAARGNVTAPSGINCCSYEW